MENTIHDLAVACLEKLDQGAGGIDGKPGIQALLQHIQTEMSLIALTATEGNISKAARRLGCKRTALSERLRREGVKPPRKGTLHDASRSL